MRKSTRKSSKKLSRRFAAATVLISLGLMLILAKNNSAAFLSSDFQQEPVKVEGFTQTKYDAKKLPKKIIIPLLSIDLLVKPARIINGYWEVFPDSAAWGETSGYPGEKGNQVIFAHARPGLFLPLRSIKLESKIYVLSDEKWYGYRVTEIKEVYPNQLEVISPTDDETLTLYTCSGFADAKRLIVVAKRV